MFVAVLVLGIGVACEDDEGGELTGRFRLNFIINEDSCREGDTGGFSTDVTIRREGETFVMDFGEAGELTGTIIDDGGTLKATGTVTLVAEVDGEPLDVPADAEIFVGANRREEGISGVGTFTFPGTFPGVEGQCVQEFTIRGNPLSIAPVLPTGPAGRSADPRTGR